MSQDFKSRGCPHFLYASFFMRLDLGINHVVRESSEASIRMLYEYHHSEVRTQHKPPSLHI